MICFFFSTTSTIAHYFITEAAAIALVVAERLFAIKQLFVAQKIYHLIGKNAIGDRRPIITIQLQPNLNKQSGRRRHQLALT